MSGCEWQAICNYLLMSLFEICQVIQGSGIGTAIRESTWVFPIIETTHVLGAALSVGLILCLDLRLTGMGMRRIPADQLMHRLKPWYLSGFVVMMMSGSLLFWSEAAKLYNSFTFRMKLVFLVLAALNALIFEIAYTPRIAGFESEGTPGGAVVAGWCSLAFWAAVIGFGRWTAYGLG